MGRITRRAEVEGVKAVYYGKNDVFLEGEPGYVEADKLAHYEDLEEAGRLVELPEALDQKKLLGIIAEFACPRWVGLPDWQTTHHCDRGGGECIGCWEAALDSRK